MIYTGVVFSLLVASVHSQQHWPVKSVKQPNRQQFRLEAELVGPAPMPFQAARVRVRYVNQGDQPLGPLAPPSDAKLLKALQRPDDTKQLIGALCEAKERKLLRKLGEMWQLDPLWLEPGESAASSRSYAAVQRWRGEHWQALFDQPGNYVLRIAYPPRGDWVTAEIEITVIDPPEKELPIVEALRNDAELRYQMLSKEATPSPAIVHKLEALVEKHPRSTYADYAWFALARAALASGDNQQARERLEEVDAEHFAHGPQVLLLLRQLVPAQETVVRAAIEAKLKRQFPNSAEVQGHRIQALTEEEWQALREAVLTPVVPEGAKELWPTWRNFGGLGPVRSIVFSQDADLFVTGQKPSILWNWKEKRPSKRFRGYRNQLAPVAITPNGTMVVIGNHDKTVRLWSVAKREEIGMLEIGASVVSLNLSKDGEFVAVGMSDIDRTKPDISIWDINAKRKVRDIKCHRDSVRAVDFSPNGEWLVSASSDQTLVLTPLRKENTERPKVLQMRESLFSCAAFAPDGQVFATGTLQGEVALWALDKSEPLAVMRGHKRDVWSLAFSPDGTLLATSGPDRCVKLWRVKDRREIATLHSVEGISSVVEGVPSIVEGISSVAFTPDGQSVIGGGFQGILLQWELEGILE